MKKLLLALIAAPLTMCAPPAYAQSDELVYLQLLNLRGIVVYDTALMLATGYRACEQLNYATGDQVIPWMAANHWDMTLETAAIVTVTAVEALCPWHDHREAV